jgi:hypothetical protein
VELGEHGQPDGAQMGQLGQVDHHRRRALRLPGRGGEHRGELWAGRQIDVADHVQHRDPLLDRRRGDQVAGRRRLGRLGAAAGEREEHLVEPSPAVPAHRHPLRHRRDQRVG